MEVVTDILHGGCLCGAIRYQVQGLPFAADYCHCRHCQKIAGAPVMAWMDFLHKDVLWLSSQPREYASSSDVRRGFCGQCGSTLTFRHVQHPDYLTLAIASLDQPDRVSPTYHIYTIQARKWCVIQDDLPRFLREQT